MKSFDHWRVRNEAKILNSEKKRTGNELPPNQAEAGGTYKIGPKRFKGQLEGFKSKLSHKEPQAEAEGLGDKGMDGVGKATFDREPVKAGQTPTISNGIPVGELKGQFEAFKTFKEFAPAAAVAPSVEMGQQDPTGQPPPEMNTASLPPAIMRYMGMALKAASHIGPMKLRQLWQVMNQKMEELIAQSSTSDSMAGTMRRRQGLLTRKGN